MNGLKIPLSSLQVEDIKTELEKVFAFQDKNLSDKKLTYLLDEIENCGFPFPAIIAGIRSLFEIDIKAVKLINIKEAIKRFIQYDTSAMGCFVCGNDGSPGVGVKIMWVGNKQYLFACRCEKGKEYLAIAPLWNGQKEQFIGGVEYTSERISTPKSV